MAEASVEKAPRRGSGWLVVARKELADHLNSVRLLIVIGIVALAGVGAVYAVASEIRGVADRASGDPLLFLRLFTIAPERLQQFSYAGLVGLLVPLLGIAFGFDAVNGERSQGTLPRLVSQPIHRDDVINGKFAAGLAVIAMMLGLLTALVAAVGLIRLGLAPSFGEITRVLGFWVVAVVYAGFWLALSMLFSVAFQRAATSALAAIAAWLVLTIFAGFLIGILVSAAAPEEPTPEEQIANAQLGVNLSRLSPATLYAEGTTALLIPERRTFDILSSLVLQSEERALPSPLSLDQSLLVVWPQVTGLLAATVICFAAAYILFMRQEVRA